MSWACLGSDRELFERELESFVPPVVFDSHAHLYDTRHCSGPVPPLLAEGPNPAGWQTFAEHAAWILPGRRLGGLFFPFPYPQADLPAANAFVRDEAARSPASRAQMLIHPAMDSELIRQTVRRDRFVGLKCYHVYADVKPTFDALIESYLPERHVRIAHEECLAITLHMVRPRAMADPLNQETIRRYAEQYPNARLILAHAARGFNPHHTIEGIGSLAGLANVWCDTSAITDCGALEAIIRTLGIERLLYGSDFPVSHMRGRCVALGDSFIWLTDENVDLSQPAGRVVPTLVGLESLRTLKLACWSLGLTDAQVERIFLRNACDLFGIDERTITLPPTPGGARGSG